MKHNYSVVVTAVSVLNTSSDQVNKINRNNSNISTIYIYIYIFIYNYIHIHNIRSMTA